MKRFRARFLALPWNYSLVEHCSTVCTDCIFAVFRVRFSMYCTVLSSGKTLNSAMSHVRSSEFDRVSAFES